jgi:hypothetical protein
MTELSVNVIENKGPLRKTHGVSGNVVENKSSYTLRAGILLKIQVVTVREAVPQIGIGF